MSARSSPRKILVCGLGGGLDVLNASIIYHAAMNEGISATLGSVRDVPIDKLRGCERFANSGAYVTQATIIDDNNRYAEPYLSSMTEEPVLFFSRNYGGKNDIERLKQALFQAQLKEDFSEMIFVDGGGDSLILRAGDANMRSQYKSPFEGGDAITLEALADFPETYLAVISAGLDIQPTRFRKNVKLLDERNAYFGRVNLRTGKKDRYLMDHMLRFKEGFLQRYFAIAEKVLVLNEEDIRDPNKTASHTGAVTYHALKGEFGRCRTYVPWEQVRKGKMGVHVNPQHCWMYFFDAAAIHQIKQDLNART